MRGRRGRRREEKGGVVLLCEIVWNGIGDVLCEKAGLMWYLRWRAVCYWMWSTVICEVSGRNLGCIINVGRVDLLHGL